jgi:hypothetical protein
VFIELGTSVIDLPFPFTVSGVRVSELAFQEAARAGGRGSVLAFFGAVCFRMAVVLVLADDDEVVVDAVGECVNGRVFCSCPRFLIYVAKPIR